MPLWNVQLPGNAALFYGFIMQIASFDLIDMMPLWGLLFPTLPKTQPINSNFDTIGYNDLYFMHNIGSISLMILAWPALALSILFMTPCTKVPCMVKLRIKLKNMIFWNSTVKTITETYTIFVMCVLINTLNVRFSFLFFQLKFETPGEITSSSLTIFFGILVILTPLILCVYMYKKFRKLKV